jgi:hypothetical protein
MARLSTIARENRQLIAHYYSRDQLLPGVTAEQLAGLSPVQRAF